MHLYNPQTIELTFCADLNFVIDFPLETVYISPFQGLKSLYRMTVIHIL